MKKLALGIVVTGLTTLFAAVPSQARDYKYCLYRDMMDGGDCSFESYEQCRASASGRAADCRLNPRWIYAPQRTVKKSKKRRSSY